MDIFFLQLVILFIPGIIWERIDSRFGTNRPSSQFDIIRRSFGFGVASYLVVDIAFVMIGFFYPVLHFHMAIFKKDTYTLDQDIINEIFIASEFAILLSIIWLYLSNNKIMFRIMQSIKATRRFGDEDVWDYVFNSREPEVEYVHVRDLENELNWSGWVELFSETGKTRELVLRDVEVSNIQGERQYSVPRVYIARPADSITIEFPYKVSNEPGAIDGSRQIATDDNGRLQQSGQPRSDASPG